MDFVLIQGGKAVGPLSAERIIQNIKAGEITKNAQIWRTPWTEWSKITNVFPNEFGLSADFLTKMEERGEVLHRPQLGVFERAEKQVPAAQIVALLRDTKSKLGNPGEVKLTADNKKDLVYTNLREAVTKGHLTIDAVEHLIRESTETGGQRIFLYRAKADVKPEVLRMSLDEVGKTLFGKTWSPTTPAKFHDLPPTPQVSWLRAYSPTVDLRTNPLGFAPATAAGWLLSIDATVRVPERIGREGANGDITLVAYAPKVEEAPVVLRYWEKLHLLELRLPNFPKRATVLELRDKILAEIGSKLNLADKFEDWSLSKACTKSLHALLYAPGDEPTLRKIAGTRIRERNRSTMRIEIENAEKSGILDSNARKQSVDAYLAEKSTVESIIATYLPVSAQEEIRVVIAADYPSEISIRKIVNSLYLDHVIFRLYQNS